MVDSKKAKVFTTGGSQAVRIPAAYRFATNEVYIQRDAQTGDLILSETPNSWDDVFALLDPAWFPEDFMVDRAQGDPQKR
jgi:antitoxin VapB